MKRYIQRSLSSLGIFLALIFSFQPNIFAGTVSYLPEGSTPPNHEQIKLTEELSSNKSASSNSDTGGDGLDPIPYRAKDGSLRIWNAYHHSDYRLPIEPLSAIVCTDAKTGERCDINNDGVADSGSSADYYIRSDGGDIHSAQNNLYPVTRYMERNSGAITVGSKMYISMEVYNSAMPNVDGQYDLYMYCFDMETASKCGYDKVNTTTLNMRGIVKGPSNTGSATTPEPGDVLKIPFSGTYLIDGKVYMIGHTKSAAQPNESVKMYCFDTATSSSCGEFTVSDGTSSTPRLNLTAGSYIPTGSSSLGNKIYVVSWNSSDGDTDVKACVEVDSSGMNYCDNYDQDLVAGNATGYTGSRYIFVVPGALCIASAAPDVSPGGSSSPVECYDENSGQPLSGSSLSITTTMQNMIDTIEAKRPNTKQTLMLAATENYNDLETGRSYLHVVTYVDESAPTKIQYHYTVCYDSASRDLCSGFGENGMIDWNTAGNALIGKKVLLYGYNKDDQGCMWGLGDPGYLVSFDPTTGTVPCLRSVGEAVVDVSEGLCDPTKGRYVYVKINNVDWSKVDNSSTEIYNAKGTLLKRVGLVGGDSGSTIDLAEIPTSGDNSKITVKVFIEANAADWDSSKPNIEVVYAPDTSKGKPLGAEGAGQPLTTIKQNGLCVPPQPPKTGVLAGAFIATAALLGMIILGSREYINKRALKTGSNK